MAILEWIGGSDRAKKSIWVLVSVALIAGLIYFADVSKILEAVRTADLRILAPAFVTGISNFGIAAYVWHSFLSSTDEGLSYIHTLKLCFAGHFLNSITPLGRVGGEPLMAYLVSRNTDSEMEEVFSAIFSADIISAIPPYTFMLGGAVFLLFFGSFNEIIIQSLYLVGLVIAFGSLFVYLLWFKAGVIESAIARALDFVSSKLGRGEALAENAEERLEKVEENFRKIGEDPRRLFKLTALMHLSFVTEIVTMYLILYSLGVQPDFAPLYFVMPLAAVAELSPTPGGAGTYEAAMAGLLTVFFPVNLTIGVTAALLYQLTGFWPANGIGYYFLHKLER